MTTLAGDDFNHDVRLIGEKLQGIEWLAGMVLYLLWYALASFWLTHPSRLNHSWKINNKYRSLLIEVYVVGCVILTVGNWWCGPGMLLTWVCSYFLASTIITLLQVLFLNKALGEMDSPERSLLLVMLNVVQIVFVFASWYQIAAPLSRYDALFKSILVFATAGYPAQEEVQTIVELQIAADVVLIAVFLAHLLGKVAASRA